MRYIKFCWLLVLGLLLGAGQGAVDAQDSAAPYLYYYSGYYHALVVERADGTDSRLLGEGLIPQSPHDLATGLLWSPSGEWLAWAVYTGSGPIMSYRDPVKAYALSVDGQRRLTTLESLEAIENIQWSPTEDLLLVVGYVHYESLYYKTSPLQIWMIDPERDNVVVQVEQSPPPVFNPEMGYIDAYWTPDGQQVVVTFYDETDNYVGGIRTIIVDRQGHSRQTFFDGPLFYGRQAKRLFNDVGLTLTNDPATSHLVVHDLLLEEEWHVPTALRPIEAVEWHEAVRGLWVTTRDPACHPTQASCTFALWQVRNGHTDLVVDDIVRLSPFIRIENGTQIRYVITAQRRVVQVDAQGRVNHLPVQLPEEVLGSDVFWRWAAGYLGVGIGPDDQWWGYDLATGRAFSLDNQPGEPRQFSVDGRYMAYMSEGAILYDTQTDETLRFSPDSHSDGTAADGLIVWHPTQNWFFTYDDSTVSGGGSGTNWIGVASADGRVRRELTLGYVSWAGWLPAQVDVSHLPAPTPLTPPYPEPVQQVYGINPHWSVPTALQWSPDSGQILYISVLNWAWLYDLQTGVRHVATLENLVPPTIVWERDADGRYQPVNLSADEIPPWEDDLLAVSANGRFGLYQDVQGDGLVVERATGVTVSTNTLTHGYIQSGALSPDGTYAVVCEWINVGGCSLYNIQTQQWVTELPPASSAAFSPDGRWLALAVSWDIWLWDVEALVR